MQIPRANGSGLDATQHEARIVHLKQRLTALQEQAQRLEDVAQQRAQLQLVVGRLEAFAAQVSDGLEHLDWRARRELIRTLVKRVDIGPEEVNVVFRVSPLPDPETPEEGRCMPLCGRRDLSGICRILHPITNGLADILINHLGRDPANLYAEEYRKQSMDTTR
jgi:hypothetical protein